MPRHRGLLIGLLTAATLGITSMVLAQPNVLQSSRHDRITVSMGWDAGVERTVIPLHNASEFSGQLAIVCVRDSAAGGSLKAFDNQRTARPRYRVPTGGRTCAQVAPARQVIYFFKDDGYGMQGVLTYRLDLRERRYVQVTFDWLTDH